MARVVGFMCFIMQLLIKCVYYADYYTIKHNLNMKILTESRVFKMSMLLILVCINLICCMLSSNIHDKMLFYIAGTIVATAYIIGTIFLEVKL